MANVKVSALTADTSPTSDDLIPTVTDPAGTPASRKVTLANAITKAHGLSDGIVKVASGTMAVATASTDYAPATSGTGVLKGNGTGGFSTATANTDYYAPKANLSATAAPGAGNDNTQGYVVGSVWVDTTNDKSYIAVDVSTGAAVWNDLTASAAGGINNVVEDLTPQLGGDLDLNGKNITAGATTISPTELSYLDGVTSAIQGQIDGKQAADADLTTLSTAFTSASASGPASLALHEDTDNGTNKITITGQSALAGDQVITLPDATGTVALTSDLSAYQPLDADLTTIAGLTATTDNFIQSKASAWASRTPTQVTADLIAMVGDSGAGGTKGLVPAPGAGDAAANKYLKADGTWTAISSGGQTLVTHIVAASGGTHTTLGAAIAAASSGDTIWVREGTYSESAITSTTTNLTIIGENVETSIISNGANNISLSGAGLKIMNLQFSGTTGTYTFNGADQTFSECVFKSTAAASNIIRFLGAGSRGYINNVRVYLNGTSSNQQCEVKYTNGIVNGLYVYAANNSSSATYGVLNLTGDYNTFSDVKVYVAAGTSTNPALTIGAGVAVNWGNYNNVAVQGASSSTTGGISIAESYYSSFSNFKVAPANGKLINMTSGSYNAFTNCVGYTANNASSEYGLYFTGSFNTISNCVFHSGGVSATAGIYINGNSNNNVVTGCFVRNFGIGIQVQASTGDDNILNGNYIMDSTTGITDAGTGTVADNNTWNAGSIINENKKYVYMKNTSGGAMSAGQLVVWKAVAAGNEVTTTTTAGDDKVFGIMIDAPANNAFGRVQTLGKNTLLKVDGTTDIAIGDPITTFTTAGIGAKATTGDMIIGYALEAYTANDSLGVIDVLLVTPRLI